MPQPAIRVSLVRTPADHRAFWTLPYSIYRRVPHWPAPLRRDERRRWDPRYNPGLSSRSVWRFVARRGSRVLGRIAAVLDPDFAARWAPDSGLFGFFETTDDPEASSALLDAAEGRLLAEGVRRVYGPVNLSFHDEMGLLVEGFDATPGFLCPFNHPYHAALLTRAGYRPAFDQHAYEWSTDAGRSALLERAARRAAHAGVHVRPLLPERWEAELRLLHELYNASFRDVWGFVPISWPDFRTRAGSFEALYRPELVRIAVLGNQAVGFVLALPDVAPILARIRGRLWPFGALHLALRLRDVHRARCMLLGILPAFTARGIAAALIVELMAAGRRLGVREGELSLVHGGNQPVRRLIEAAGGTRTRTYRVYQKPLIPDRSSES